MPKVTVVTLPEEALQVAKPQLKAPKPQAKVKRRRLVFGGLFYELRDIIMTLVYRDNLPVNILALLLGRMSIMGEMAPFGLAFFAAVAQVARERAAGAAVWALAGVLSTGNFAEACVYLFAITLYFCWRDKLTLLHRKMLAVPLLMFCSVTVAGLAANLLQQGTLYTGVTAIFSAAICMVASYSFRYGIPLLLSRTRVAAACRQATSENLVCLIIILALAIAGLGHVMVFGYTVRNIAGGLLVMLMALAGGSGLGASVGVAVGLVVGLSDSITPLAIALYAVAGGMAGVFRSLGKFAVLLGFVLGSAIIHLCFTQVTGVMQAIAESAVAAGLFLVFPVSRLIALRDSINFSEREEAAGMSQVNEAVAKMSNIAEMFNELAGAFSVIAADTQEKIRDEELAGALTAVGEQVCEKCDRRSDCWEQDFYRTYQAVLDMLGQAEQRKLAVNSIPGALSERCMKCMQLVEVVNMVVERNHTLSFWQKKIVDHRQMVTEQMKAAGAIIGNLAQEITKVPRSDREAAAALREKAAIVDCLLDSVRVIGAKGTGVIEACKQPCNGTRECINTILPLAASVMKEKMTLHAQCGNAAQSKKCKLTMQAVNRFAIETGVASAAKEQGVCGDTCAIVPINKGKMVLMLSDGMGSGSQAADESAMAVRFLEKLLAVGFDVDVAVKTVNSMLLLRTPDESFATVDMAIIDTYSGKVEFLKVGSAPSFVKRVREVATIKSASLPMGVLNQIEIESVKAVMVAGDVLVMVSDGIADIGHGNEKDSWVANFLRRTSCVRPQELADRILAEAVALSGGYVRDDMMVLVARIGDCPSIV